jgi:hypothetical protein
VSSIFAFEGEMTCLEIARGHDGFFRGNPEPVVVVAAYLAQASSLQLVGRTLHRFRATSPFPSEASVDRRPLPSGGVRVGTNYSPHWIVLAAALEEDGGKDVQRVFAAVEHHSRLSIWRADGADLEPMSLLSLPSTDSAWGYPREVDVFVDGQTLGNSCRSDKWIGAVCWTLTGAEGAGRSRFRLPFVSKDERNDWTAIAEISASRHGRAFPS